MNDKINSVKQNKTEKYKEKIEKDENVLEKEIEDLENRVRRILADYQNLEKRVEAERKEWIKRANKGLITKLLPALDVLVLSANHIKDEGLMLSIQKFFDILKSEGVEKIETVGREFDPNFMECITTAKGEENKVIKELRMGFRMGDQVLRASQVTVGSGMK